MQFGCRYAHSMVERDTGTAIHLDGAVRMYSEEKMVERLDKRINKAGKHSLYTKLWRIDGEVDTITWKSLVSSYFRDNTLIGEYLGGADSKLVRHMLPGNENLDKSSGDKYEYVPYSMDTGDGLRIAISYQYMEHKIGETLTHHISTYDRLSDGEKNIWILDSRLIDFLKLLAKAGARTQKPSDFTIVKFQDGYVNFPTIWHANNQLEENIRLTENVIHKIVRIWHTRNLDITLAYSFGYRIDDRSVLISIMGHIDDVWKWLEMPVSQIPLSKDKLDSWSEKVTDYLDSNYPSADDCPPLGNTLQDSGLLAILRQQPKNLKTEYFVDEFGLRFNASGLDNQAISLINSGDISLSGSFILSELTCTNCNQQYIQCDCNSLLDSSVSRRVDSCRPLPLHWTDRHHA